MKELLEQGIGVAVLGGIAGIGAIFRIVWYVYYKILLRACKRMEETKHKTILYIKKDLADRTEAGQTIGNGLVYTECRLAECKVAGLRIVVPEGSIQPSALLPVLSGILFATVGIAVGCDRGTILQMLLCGGTASVGLVLLDLIIRLREKYNRVRLCIRDYIENSRTYRKEETQPEVMRGNIQKERTRKAEKKEKKHKEVKEKRKENRKVHDGDKLKKAGKKHGKAQEEKRRLTEELLRERRQLEARSFAEQRRKKREAEAPEDRVPADTIMAECPEKQVQAEAAVMVSPVEQGQAESVEPESPVDQVQAEAAVTESPGEQIREALSYEALLNEFLREYPA